MKTISKVDKEIVVFLKTVENILSSPCRTWWPSCEQGVVTLLPTSGEPRRSKAHESTTARYLYCFYIYYQSSLQRRVYYIWRKIHRCDEIFFRFICLLQIVSETTSSISKFRSKFIILYHKLRLQFWCSW